MDLNEIINRPTISFVPKFASAEVDWYETERGVVMDVWGEDADREVAAALQVVALTYHGMELTHHDFDTMQKTADWNDIMEKAKRLIQGNQVMLLRNGYTNIVATVQGDHGQYEVEIGRQDPASRVITNWHCQCPWAQFSFDRTRKWKKYEQRPCSHVLATYWKSLGTPLDEDVDQGQQPPQAPPGAEGVPKPPGGGAPPGGPGAGGEAPIGVRAPAMPANGPRTFLPSGEMLPAEGQGELQGMPQAPPPMQQPANKGVIPPFPGEQMQLWEQWQGPGTTDGGQPSPPWAVSVPGAKPTTPFNPVQSPGTYSKVVWAADYQSGQQVQLLENEYAIEQGGQGNYVLITARLPNGRPRVGQVMGQDDTTGWVEVMFSMDNNGPGEARYAIAYLDPGQISPSQMLPPGQVGPRRKY